MLWNGDTIEVVEADSQPLKASANAIDAQYYEEDIGCSEIQREDGTGRIIRITMRRALALGADKVHEDSERPALADLFDPIIHE